jgi:phosphoenolpyruvate carboxykinase (ATP)
VVDGYAGWDLDERIKIRVICTRSYHALFMTNMLIRPTQAELDRDFAGGADYYIFNAGEFRANKHIPDVVNDTAVSLNFELGKMVILGSQYAGEMKKGVFTIMNYLMPKKGHLPLHSSCNVGKNGDVCLFFGLSGTGKTALSAVGDRELIGDDEHVWSHKGVFNIEGGCYAKCIGLTPEKEPEIYNAIKFGTVLENVGLDDHTREVNFNDISITENTRASYPLEFIPNAKLPAVTGHPKNIIFLTCDAFSVLPPVSKLTPEQAIYHFYSGYTAKIAGTEQGVKEPTPTFSACFGEAFLPLKPQVYADLLLDKINKHGTNVWLVNTGWTGGRYGYGKVHSSLFSVSASKPPETSSTPSTTALLPMSNTKPFQFSTCSTPRPSTASTPRSSTPKTPGRIRQSTRSTSTRWQTCSTKISRDSRTMPQMLSSAVHQLFSDLSVDDLNAWNHIYMR